MSMASAGAARGLLIHAAVGRGGGTAGLEPLPCSLQRDRLRRIITDKHFAPQRFRRSGEQKRDPHPIHISALQRGIEARHGNAPTLANKRLATLSRNHDPRKPLPPVVGNP